jgi:hypothetical protein
MMREAAFLLLLMIVGLVGCTKTEDSHPESIPDIPPGRSSDGSEAGDHLPMAPPAE